MPRDIHHIILSCSKVVDIITTLCFSDIPTYDEKNASAMSKLQQVRKKPLKFNIKPTYTNF